MPSDKPKSKLKKEDKELVERATRAIEGCDTEALELMTPLLLERSLLNYSKADILEGTLLNLALCLRVRNKEAAEVILNSGASISIGDYRKVTPLMKAASFDLPLTHRLLQLGANCQEVDTFGKSALHHAASSIFSSDEILSELVRAGADVNARENAGRTPLHSAAGLVNPGKIRCLLNLGADPSIQAGGTLGTPFEYLTQLRPHEAVGQRQECLNLLIPPNSK